jgi:hypothetical protein
LSYRDLSRAHQVSMKWNLLANETWSSKNRIILDFPTIFGFLDSPTDHSLIDYSGLFYSLASSRLNSKNITHLSFKDIANYQNQKIDLIIKLVEEKFSNLLVLKHLKFNKTKRAHFELYFSSDSCSYLRKLSFNSKCDLDDDFLLLIFDNCKYLENLKLVQSKITGSSFNFIQYQRFKKLKFIDCEKIEPFYFRILFNKCKNLIKLVIKCDEVTADFQILDSLTSNLKQVQKLAVPLSQTESNSCIYALSRLKHLEYLTVYDCVIGNEAISNILSSCMRLKYFELYNKEMFLDNQSFTLKAISCSLNTLKIHYGNNYVIDTNFLYSLNRLSSSLTSLSLNNLSSLSNDDVLTILSVCKKVNWLELNGTGINEILLFSLLKMDKHFYISCKNSLVNVTEFLRDKKDNYFYKLLSCNRKKRGVVVSFCYRFFYQKLKFDCYVSENFDAEF